MRDAVFGFGDALRLTDAKPTQLTYWVQAPLITAGIREGDGPGHHRLFSYANLIEISIAVALAQQGVKLPSIRTVLRMVKVPSRPPRKPLDRVVFLMGDPKRPSGTWMGTRAEFITEMTLGAESMIFQPVGTLVDVDWIIRRLDARIKKTR